MSLKLRVVVGLLFAGVMSLSPAIGVASGQEPPAGVSDGSFAGEPPDPSTMDPEAPESPAWAFGSVPGIPGGGASTQAIGWADGGCSGSVSGPPYRDGSKMIGSAGAVCWGNIAHKWLTVCIQKEQAAGSIVNVKCAGKASPGAGSISKTTTATGCESVSYVRRYRVYAIQGAQHKNGSIQSGQGYSGWAEVRVNCSPQ